jgi:heparan-alpha-glucosaminide N-acetyltransferase
MNEVISKEQNPVNRRIESIDVLRGITILVMLFVNDIAGVADVPGWMKHMAPTADGMTFVDIVFPAFLFIVGMAIPFSIGKRLQKGESIPSVWKHVLIRTIGLLIIGVFMVNSGSIAKDALIHPQVWNLLMYTGIMLVWNVMPGVKEANKNKYFAVKISGIILLIIAILIFKGNSQQGIIQLQTKWWGIIGLIGWAYLVACMFYIPMRKHLAGLMGAVAILYCVYIGNESGYFSGFGYINSWVDIGKFLGSHSALVLSGAILGIILSADSPVKTHNERLKWIFWYALGMAFAGSLLHQLSTIDKMFIINKNMATPPWCLWSSAFTVWLFLIIYWIIDVRGWKKWIKIVEPAGSNALFAYILAPVFYSIFVLLSRLLGGFNFYSYLGAGFETGLIRSIVFAFAMTWLAGYLRKKGLWLKL